MTRRRLLGAGLLGLGVLALVLLLARPEVRTRLGRVAGLLAHDAFASARGDPRHALSDTTGLRRGDPVYLDARAGGLRPVAYVTAVEPDGVAVRVVPGETLPPGARLVRLAPPAGLGEAYQLAVPPEVAARLQSEIRATLESLLRESILPEVRRRLPAFLARVDPREDERAGEVVDALGAELLGRLRPLGEDLARRVASDVEARFDLLERLGLLWDLLKGDAQALREQVTPVAVASARAWWEDHQDQVLTSVGQGLEAQLPTLRDWVVEDVWPAARDEIAAPVLEAQGERIEAAAEQLMRRVGDAVVEAPDGGFRLRFRTVLRTRLLEKREPLLLFVEDDE